jgi:8-amino-7-oxononanoate synthase
LAEGTRVADEHKQWLAEAVADLQARHQLRQLSATTLLPDGRCERAGRQFLNLASNDYLGLALEPFQPADDDVWGAAAARLVSGNAPIYDEFEQQFADFKKTETVMLFNSGYSANIGILSSLCGRHDVVFGDRFNHASIVDGILLSRAELIRYPHRDLDVLEAELRNASPAKRKWIVTDAVFSMDGTVAPLSDLVTLKERYGAMLIVDEAHSGGLYGEQGQGLTHLLGLTAKVDVQMGTFSKAYGRFGAYVACDQLIRTYLVNKARSFIYTTALPPVMVAAVRDNWHKVRTQAWRRSHVFRLAAQFRAGLLALGMNTADSECQIVPLVIGENDKVIRLSERLQEAGLLAVPIRPPSVPQGTARIRFSWSAAHQSADVDWALAVIGSALS